MFASWKFAAVTIGVVLVGTACSSSGSPSTEPGGQTSASPPVSIPTTPDVGLTTPAVTGVPGGEGECKISASEVSDIAGAPYEASDAAGGACLFISADGAINIVSGEISGGEEMTIAGLESQFTDLEPIPGEDHAYTAKSTGQVWLVADNELVLVGSSTLTTDQALAIAKAYAD
jgi:hypothetical protein